jgi:hypothetical protein
MAERKADKLAGKGSILDKLRRRREALEGGRLAEITASKTTPDKTKKPR